MNNIDSLILPSLLICCWFFWTFFSPTRENHGILIAFLLPPGMVLFAIIYIIYGLVRLFVYPFFFIFGGLISFLGISRN